jgi:hypothetical protein
LACWRPVNKPVLPDSFKKILKKNRQTD